MAQSPRNHKMITNQAINDRYRILKPLGKGGMGEVYLVEDQTDPNHAQLALKLLNLDHQDSGEILKWFKKEFHILAEVNHTGLARVFDFGRDQSSNRAFFTSEYVAGPDLFSFSKNKSTTERLKILLKLVQTLDYLYAKGIVHRDLKPGNILIDAPTHQVKIIDFGLSELKTNIQKNSNVGNKKKSFCGTLEYAAPELLMGNPATLQSDIYALGMIFYKILSGQLPHTKPTRNTVLKENLESTWTTPNIINPDIPEAISSLILKMLAKELRLRPSNLSEITAELELVLQQVGYNQNQELSPLGFIQSAGLIGRTKELKELKDYINQKIRTSSANLVTLLEETISISSELTKLGLEDSADHQAPLMVVNAKPGLGKTALLQRIKHAYQIKDILVLVKDCNLDQGPLGVFKSLLGEIKPHCQAQDSLFKQWTALNQKIERFLSISDKPKDTHNLTDLFSDYLHFLQSFFDQVPFLICFDNLDKIDEVSLNYLTYLIEKITTYQQICPPIIGFLSDQQLLKNFDDTEVKFIALEKFSIQETQLFLQEIFSGHPLPKEFGENLCKCCDGNPRYMQDWLLERVYESLIERNVGQWHFHFDLKKIIQPPKNFSEFIKNRYDQSNSFGKSILNLSLLFNQPIPNEIIKDYLKIDEHKLQAEVTHLKNLDLLVQSENNLFIENHNLSQLVKSKLTPKLKQKIHIFFARTLKKSKKFDPGFIGVHFFYAKEFSEAVDLFLNSAHKNFSHFAYKRSYKYFSMALRSVKLGKLEQYLCAKPYFGLAENLWRLGKRKQACRYYNLLLTLFSDADWNEEVLEAIHKIGINLRDQGKWYEAQSIFEKGLKQIKDKEPAQYGLFNAQIALVCLKQKKFDQVNHFMNIALNATVKSKKTKPQYISTYLILAGLDLELKNLESAQKLYEHIFKIANQSGHRRHQITALNNMGSILMRQGSYEKATIQLKSALELSREIEDKIRICNGLYLLGKVYYVTADFRSCISVLSEALKISHKSVDFNLQARICLILGRSYRDVGNHMAAGQKFNVAMDLSKKLKNKTLYEDCVMALSNNYAQIGIFEKSENLIKKILGKIKQKERKIEAYLNLCQIKRLSGDIKGARTLLKIIDGDLSKIKMKALVVSARLEACELYLLMDKYDQAKNKMAQIKSETKKLNDLKILGWYEFLRIKIDYFLIHKSKQNTNRYKKIISDLKPWTTGIKPFRDFGFKIDLYEFLAKVYENLEQTDMALEFYRMANHFILEKADLLDSKTRKILLGLDQNHSIQERIDALSHAPGQVNLELAATNQSNHQLRRLLEVNRQLAAGWQDQTQLLRLIVDTALEITKGNRGFLILKKGDNWQEVVQTGETKTDTPSNPLWSKSIVTEVYQSGRPLLIADAGHDPELSLAKSVHNLNLRSVLCTPLKRGVETIGVIYIDHDQLSGVFLKISLDYLNALADQANVVLQQSDVYSRLVLNVEQANQELRRMRSVVKQQNRTLEWKYAYEQIIGGKDSSMKELFKTLDQIAPSDLSVLIQGESGTGKELVARALHHHGPRKDKPFVTINCASLNATFLKSELFGHVQGAFTGAVQDHEGLFQIANGGTIFLDEVAELPLDVQAGLLRTLQSGEVSPLGSNQVYQVDVRIISAANRSIEQLVHSGQFREDFYYRLRVVEIEIPPLRERRYDLDLLIKHFINQISVPLGLKHVALSKEAHEIFCQYSWPGNVRELHHTLEEILVLHMPEKIEYHHLPENLVHETQNKSGQVLNLEETRQQATRDYLKKILQLSGDNKAKAARLAGISRQGLYDLLIKHDLLDPKK